MAIFRGCPVRPRRTRVSGSGTDLSPKKLYITVIQHSSVDLCHKYKPLVSQWEKQIKLSTEGPEVVALPAVAGG